MMGRLWHRAYLSTSPETRLRAQQQLFFLILAPASVIFAMFRPHVLQVEFFWIGTGSLLLASAGAYGAVRGPRLRWAQCCLPLLDLMALGFTRASTLPEGATLSFVAFFPALWLVIELHRVGMLLAALGTIGAITVPSVLLAENPLDPLTMLRNLVLPLVVVVVSQVVVDLYQRLAASKERVEQESARHVTARDEARRSARLLTAVGDSLNVGVLVMDTDGNDLMWNRAQRVIHELVSPPTNTDRTEAGHLVFAEDGSTPLPTALRPAYRAVHGESFDDQIIMVGPPGPEQRALSVSARKVHDDRGIPEGSVVVFYDVTDLRAMVRARDEFIATVSHELRTPLTSIMGYIDLAIEEVGPIDGEAEEPLADYLAVVERNAEQMLILVEDLLVEQQARAGRLVLHRRQVRLSDLASVAVRSIGPQASAQQITVVDRTGPTSPVLADHSRIGQVLDNLLANAVKYTQPGGRVDVRTHETDTTVEFCVSDNGRGLTADDVARIFTPFFRSTARGTRTSGLGLGLAVAKSIIDAHGGTISVDSTLGEGTTFRVSLPRPTAGALE
ncbi:PAS fold-containing protein [Brevibacterium jeotgali]|uniref:histidine kinase n=2 Tax=Brevibacterium jeotgali TaxID=1262550 RepID=A0A2H1L7Y8_9MICO|nr:PAS domain-containing protein [Brevibacterium jeotgali]SMY12895.1 PAS fold-containing protein [Brevibacterium jeotgali]